MFLACSESVNPYPQVHSHSGCNMRSGLKPATLVMVVLILLLIAPYNGVAARTIHDAHSVDLFPSGDFSQPNQWAVDDTLTYSNDPATYTETMVAENKLSFIHQRPLNSQQYTFWAQTSTTDSNASRYAPDLAYSWSTGPEISVNGFNFNSYDQYELLNVELLLHIRITDALYQDSVRISTEYSGQYDLIKTFAHTTGELDFMNNPAWTYSLGDGVNNSWENLSSLEVTLDYVSVGSTDDSQLNVDAVGLRIEYRSAWYGGEVGHASSSISGIEVPISSLDLASGIFDNIAYSSCGLESSIEGTSGSWTSDTFETPPSQRIGRIHYELANESLDDVILEYASSSDGIIFSNFSIVDENILLPDVAFVKVKVSTITACINSISIDINDPRLSISGQIMGNLDGFNSQYTRWMVYIDGDVLSNEAITAGSFSLSFPIGKYLTAGQTSIDVEIKSWFNWDSEGNKSTTIVEINSVAITGGYELEWDEDPVCTAVGDQTLIEDGSGIILPFTSRCSDDRTALNDLQITLENSNPDVVTVDLAQGDIRISLKSEESGQAVVTTTVSDSAGNIWSETFTIIVESVNDSPVVNEFPSLVPVEHDYLTEVELLFHDVDSTTLTAFSNRSWAVINLELGIIEITAPNPGYHSVLISVCDTNSCSERVLDLEVLALPDLIVESIDIGDDTIREGDLVDVRVYVRNNGRTNANLISVRCDADNVLIAIPQPISFLEPGELGVVTCSWIVPEGDELVVLSAVVDRGLEIDEVDESNNEAEIVVTIEAAEIENPASDGLQISSTMMQTLTVVSLLAIIGLFALFAPSKIRKIE